MVICRDCKKNMSKDEIKNCDFPFVIIGNELFKRNTTYFDIGKRCHDCNILNKDGNIHHFGCDMERCPKCKGQLISCGCGNDNRFPVKMGKVK